MPRLAIIKEKYCLDLIMYCLVLSGLGNHSYASLIMIDDEDDGDDAHADAGADDDDDDHHHHR